MKLRAAVLGVVLGLAAVAAGARGDTITLDTGKSLSGRIVERKGGLVVIELDGGGRITLPARRVVAVIPDAEEPPLFPLLKPRTPPQPAKDTGAEGAEGTGSASAPGGEPPKAESAPAGPAVPPPDRETAARITALVEAMGTSGGDDAREARREARAALVVIGEPALPAVCAALEDANGHRRLGAAMVLGEIGSKKTARALLLALYLGTPEKGKQVPWWDQGFLNACARSFGAVGGSTFGYDSDDSTAGGAAARMLEWWGENWEEYPAQVGEEPRKPPAEGEEEKKPDPVKEIQEMPRRSFPAPAAMGARGRG
jgi:hypothetical protein